LQHAIERSVILAEGSLLKPSDFFLNRSALKEENINPDIFNLEEIEKSVIQKALLKFEGNISKTACELGLTRTSLYRRMEKHGL
jgi:DNA-binding NtrC family response regulator